jgi:hypothetical protein
VDSLLVGHWRSEIDTESGGVRFGLVLMIMGGSGEHLASLKCGKSRPSCQFRDLTKCSISLINAKIVPAIFQSRGGIVSFLSCAPVGILVCSVFWQKDQCAIEAAC